MFNQLNETSQQVMQKMKNNNIPSVAITRLEMHNKPVQVTWAFFRTVVGLQLQHECQETQAAFECNWN
jgi:hypothetical protein